MQVKKPSTRITYNSRDITRDVTAFLIELTYAGEVKGSADTIELTFEDSAALWRNNWYPAKGDKVNIEIGYTDLMISVGTFAVDEIAMSGAPDQIVIRGISVGFSKALRTKTSVAHEKKTLAQIVKVLADKSGLTVSGTIPDIFIKRATQYRETDLNFLNRLASQYGCLFSIRDQSLIFTLADNIEAIYSGTEIDRTDLISYSLTDKTSDSCTRVSVKYHSPKNNKTISASVDSGNGVVPSVPNELWQDPASIAQYTAADEMEIRCRVENEGQARSIAKSFLRKNLETLTGTITIEGNPLLMEGSNFDFTGMGAMSGRFAIARAEHRINASGYITTLDIKRIGLIDKSRWQPKQIITNIFSSTK